MNDRDIVDLCCSDYFSIQPPDVPIIPIHNRLAKRKRHARSLSRALLIACLALGSTGLAIAGSPTSGSAYSYIQAIYQRLLAPTVVPTSTLAQSAHVTFRIPEHLALLTLNKTTRLGSSGESYILDYHGHGCSISMTVSRSGANAANAQRLSALPGDRVIFGDDRKGLNILGDALGCNNVGGILNAFYATQ